MADKILTFNGKTISGPSGTGIAVLRVPDPPSHTVTIGGRTYPTVTIGNQEWMAENLDWKFTGLNFRDSQLNPVDRTETIQATYYNYDESTYGINGNKYGLLYNWYAVDYLNEHLAELEVPEGWHVPSNEEWDILINYIGSSDAGKKIKSTTEWNNGGNGTDDYGFSAYPSAGCTGTFSDVTIGDSARFWSSNTTGHRCKHLMYSNDVISMSRGESYFYYSLRLVKNLS